MADVSNIRNYVLNLRNVSKENSTVKVPVSFESYGSLKKGDYTKDSPADMKNEPKLLIAPFNNIVLTNGQFGGYETDLGYLKNTKYVNITQGLDSYYKSKIWFDNYGLGDKEAKYHFAINESVDELPLISDAYNRYIQENKTARIMGYVNSGAQLVAGAAAVVLPFKAPIIDKLTIGSAKANLANLDVGSDRWKEQSAYLTNVQKAYAADKQQIISGTGFSFGVNNLLSGASGIINQVGKEHDLKNVPDTVRSAGNNLMYDYLNNDIKLYTYNTRPQQFYLERAWQWMFRYGYQCDEFKVPDLRSRYYFNYIMTRDIKINADIPTLHAERLKAIFNQGTTIWHYRDDNTNPEIGNYTKENVEVSLNV